MSTLHAPEGFDPIVRHFTSAARATFATCLERFSPQLAPDEVRLIQGVAEDALHANARRKLYRVLLLEMHAAKRAGMLTAADDADRFEQFVAYAMRDEFAALLDRYYPSLRARLGLALNLQCDAIEKLLMRFVADRSRLDELMRRPPGRLVGLALGQGDLHQGGQSVARLAFEGGSVMYKPRSVAIDATLDAFLAHLFGQGEVRIRVPEVIDCGEYGWAAFVEQRYCQDDVELHTFYRGLGHWLAVLRLLGGTDIHLENLVAVGPVPVVVDVESLFARPFANPPSNYGDAYDLAQELICDSVLRTGIVPVRTSAFGLGEVDFSAAGGMPGEQPKLRAPTIANEGTTDARVEIIAVEMDVAQNHPSPQPELPRFWNDIGDGFLEATEQLRKLDVGGQLKPRMEAFIDCRVREIRRPTRIYAEIGHMLWHPSSLHEEAKALEQAHELLAAHAATLSMAPSAAQEIAGEIDDLCHGDIPMFTALLTDDRIEATLANWRTMRVELEEMAIRTALVVKVLNHQIDQPGQAQGNSFAPALPSTDFDRDRRRLASEAMKRLLHLAVRGKDGSATWIAPGASPSGWHVRPLHTDLYSGLGGVAVALAAYLRETERGRADPVPDVAQVLDGTLQVLHAMTDAGEPSGIGGFTGYGSYIWYWLVLHDLLKRPELLAKAIACAKALERQGFDEDRSLDIIDGSAGVIVPLLGLAEKTGDSRWLDLAARAGRRLESTATLDEHGARWSTLAFEDPIGGFAHGAAGIGWALARLALSDAGEESDRQRWETLASAAFDFQDSLFDTSMGNWCERAEGHVEIYTWCGGSVGIGLAAIDLYQRSGDTDYLRDLRRALAAAGDRWNSSHTLCHGNFSQWELLVRASELDPASAPIGRDEANVHVISAIEQQHDLAGSLTYEAFAPSLMTGLAGVIYSLLRMHPDSRLATPLLMECRE